MKKNLFSGWREVFSFTLMQGTSGNKFKLSTIGITILLFAIGLAVNLLMAVAQKSETEVSSPIEKVYVIDESGLEMLYFDGFLTEYKEDFPLVTFETTEKEISVLAGELGENAPHDVILRIAKEEEGYLLNLIIPNGSEVSEEEGENLADALTTAIEQSKLLSSGIPMEKLVLAMSGVSVNELDAGEEEKSVGELLVSMLVPMLCIFVIYIMILIYGQSISNIVTVEKSSKLMEMLLTLTQPYGLIFGKIFAMVTIALMQMFLWIIGLVSGFVVGNYVAAQFVYPNFSNPILEVFTLLQMQEGSTAFSAGAIILAIFTMCLSFLFWCVLSGMVASFASKAEELAQINSYYQIIVVIGFMLAYLLPLQEKDGLNTLLRIIPITSAFMLPGDILVGNIVVWEGVVYMAILFVATILLTIMTGKIYKDQLFYKGTKLFARLHHKKA